MRSILIVLTMLAAQPALAAPEWRTHDSVYAGLSAAAGSLTGALVGGLIGERLAGDCDKTRSDDDDDFFGPCAFHGLAETMIGGLVVSNVGAMAGVSIYAESQGFDGSRWASLGGAVGGMALGGLAAYGVAAAVDDQDVQGGLMLTGLLLGQATGAVLGYVWTLEPSDDVQVVHGGCDSNPLFSAKRVAAYWSLRHCRDGQHAEWCGTGGLRWRGRLVTLGESARLWDRK